MQGSTGDGEGWGGPPSDGSEAPDRTPGVDPVAELRRGLSLEACPYLAPAPGAPPVDPATAPRCLSNPGDPWALSDRQRTLVCLTDGHLECPRYRRATTPDGVAAPAARPRIPRATLVATLVLALSLAAAVGSMAMNGGIRTPTAPSHQKPTQVAGASEGAASTSAEPSSADASTASPPGSPTAVPSVAASPSPAPSPAASPAATGPSPVTTASPRPTSDRYALLVACPGKPDCYTYTVRAGDNLTSIGLYFGVPFDTILRLNPWIRDPTTIRRGQVIVLPPPTR